MFIGDGAKLVRDAFALAKEKTPAIIFIDELDAIGKYCFFIKPFIIQSVCPHSDKRISDWALYGDELLCSHNNTPRYKEI